MKWGSCFTANVTYLIFIVPFPSIFVIQPGRCLFSQAVTLYISKGQFVSTMHFFSRTEIRLTFFLQKLDEF